MRNQTAYSRRPSSSVASVLLAALTTLAVTACAFEADEVIPSPGSGEPAESIDVAVSEPGADKVIDDGAPRAVILDEALEPGIEETGLAGATGAELRYHLPVPAGATNLRIRIAGGTGDADLYVKRDQPPTTRSYDRRSQCSTNNDAVQFATPAAGTYHVLVRAYATFSGASLLATYDVPAPPPSPPDAGVPPPSPPDAGVPPPSPPDAAPSTGPDCRNPASWPAEWTAFEDEVLVRINQARAAGATCGTTAFPPVGPLTMNAQLRQAARCHSLDMAVNNYFSHTGRNGSSPWDRINDAGYRWRNAAENIAAGYGTPQQAVDGWVRSQGHCENLMNGELTETGVGYGFDASSTYDRYWTETFGRPL